MNLSAAPLSRSGYILFEVVLALTIFAVGVVGLAGALKNGLETAVMLSKENNIRIGLRSFVEETRRKQLSDMATQATDDQLGVTYTSSVDTLSIKNQDGTVLTDLYVLHAKAEWGEGSDAHDESVDLYLYEPGGVTLNSTPAAGAASTPSSTSSAGSPGQ